MYAHRRCKVSVLVVDCGFELVIESSFDPGERLQAPGSLWL
jgi:hypothetical protein